jgi:hypothetical protein
LKRASPADGRGYRRLPRRGNGSYDSDKGCQKKH